MISKAQKIDSDEEVIGYRIIDSNTEESYILETEEIDVDCFIVMTNSISARPTEIDPSTLKHSLDNGKTWRTEEEITSDLLAMDTLRRLKDK